MPISTYRLQLHPGFTFGDAQQVLSYLAALGVTDCYCSPIFTARPGSTHGYDVCNHNEINPELGGEAAFGTFAAALKALGLGQIIDAVPNHMGNDVNTNEWWRDVLENGPSSPFARFFDIDWDPVKPELKDRLLLPILGEQYGEALERGLLQLAFESGALTLDYQGHRVPINPRRSPLVFEHGLAGLESALGDDHPDLREFLSILTALRNLPPYTERDERLIAERKREKEVARERLARLAQTSPAVRAHIDAAVRTFNGVPGEPGSVDRLHELLELQAYRLASWRTAADEINYRRFFDVNELAGLRVEEPKVFEQIHALLLRLVGERTVKGIRLDHIDGLFDPTAYLHELREASRRVMGRPPGGETGRPSQEAAGATADASDAYIVVEKILSGGEVLREDWPVDGTTGYTFLNDVNGLFVHAERAAEMRRIYGRFTGRHHRFWDVAYESKRLIVSTALSSEFQVLAQAVNRLSEHERRWRDFTLGSIRRALREVVACFPVYRTYVSDAGISDRDRAMVEAAIADARARNPAMETSIFDFLRSVLLPEGAGLGPAQTSDVVRQRLEVAMRFQQYTAPVQAKGVEDTAFYRYHALISLNEVGGEPDRFGRSVDEFHRANLDRARRWPREMLATATHDTKRGEDARARLNVLSEIPDEWKRAVSQWMRINRRARTPAVRGTAPDPNDEYLFYQTLLGAWPADRLGDGPPQAAPAALVERLRDCMRKAIKEAKTHTSWITENQEYEAGVARFVDHVLDGRAGHDFVASFVPFAGKVARLGMLNSLAQLVLKMVSPGVSDFYQGAEFWDLNLVDPDNRRPVDYASRRLALGELEPLLALAAIDGPDEGREQTLGAAVTGMLTGWTDARIKMFVTACGLRLRRARPSLFVAGAYHPLQTQGLHGDHLVACGRQHGTDLVMAVVPRLTGRWDRGASWLPVGGETWVDTRIMVPDAWAHRTWRNLLTGERLAPLDLKAGGGAVLASRALRVCPVALLWAEPQDA